MKYWHSVTIHLKTTSLSSNEHETVWLIQPHTLRAHSSPTSPNADWTMACYLPTGQEIGHARTSQMLRYYCFCVCTIVKNSLRATNNGNFLQSFGGHTGPCSVHPCDTPLRCLLNVGLQFLIYPSSSKFPVNWILSNCNAVHQGAPLHRVERRSTVTSGLFICL